MAPDDVSVPRQRRRRDQKVILAAHPLQKRAGRRHVRAFGHKIAVRDIAGGGGLKPQDTGYYTNRKSKRVKTFFNATLHRDGEKIPVMTVNVSEGGVAVHSTKALEIESRVQYLVTGFESVPEFIVDAVILSCRAVEGGYQLGMKFPALNKAQKQTLIEQSKKAG